MSLCDENVCSVIQPLKVSASKNKVKAIHWPWDLAQGINKKNRFRFFKDLRHLETGFHNFELVYTHAVRPRSPKISTCVEQVVGKKNKKAQKLMGYAST